MIRVSELRVDFDEVCAVRDLSLEVGRGEVCGLIGPNGAGKTTTMRALLGLIEPTYGEIELAGVDIREHPQDAWRAVGFMPDFAPMYDDLKCWEFLDLFAASFFIPRPERPRLVARYLDLVGLTEKRDALIAGLSRGMRQRLMLAKTLVPDPNVLMLDEPAGGLDPQGRIDLKNIIKRLRSEGKTVLISSHVLAEMTEFCTSVAIMERGRMVVNGTIKDVAARVMGGTVLEIELLDGEEAFRRVIAADPHAGPIERHDGRFSIPYQGGAEATSDLLGLLVQNGVRVVAFAARKEGLEDLFLKVGARELS